jgi:hypothetical protein
MTLIPVQKKVLAPGIPSSSCLYIIIVTVSSFDPVSGKEISLSILSWLLFCDTPLTRIPVVQSDALSPQTLNKHLLDQSAILSEKMSGKNLQRCQVWFHV